MGQLAREVDPEVTIKAKIELRHCDLNGKDLFGEEEWEKVVKSLFGEEEWEKVVKSLFGEEEREKVVKSLKEKANSVHGAVLQASAKQRQSYNCVS